MEVCSKISDIGTFIVPQNSTPFKYSGSNFFIDYQDSNKKYGNMSTKVSKFMLETGFIFNFNLGIDTTIYLNQWKGVNPVCEIVNIDYSGKYY